MFENIDELFNRYILRSLQCKTSLFIVFYLFENILERQAFQLLLAIDQPNEFSLAFGISIFESKFKFGGFWNAFGSGSIQRLLRNIHNDGCTEQEVHTLYVYKWQSKEKFSTF